MVPLLSVKKEQYPLYRKGEVSFGRGICLKNNLYINNIVMILWIDPGVRKLWYALIESDCSIVDSGILLLEVKKPTRDDQFMRIKDIYEYFEKLLKKHKVDTLSIEKLFFTKFNQSNAEFVYGIRWAIILLALKKNITIKEFTPIQLKKYITWNAKAGKENVVRAHGIGNQWNESMIFGFK